MKKNLLLVFLVLFALNSAVFAGLGDPKKGSEKTTTTRENKMSEEEISRLAKHAETDNLSASSLSNKEKSDSKSNLQPPQEIYVESHHHGLYYGGAGLILLIILIIVLV